MNLYEYEEKLLKLKESVREYGTVKRELENEKVIFDEISDNEYKARNKVSSIGEEICCAIRCKGFNDSIISAIDYSQSNNIRCVSEKAKDDLYNMQYDLDKKIYLIENEIDDLERQIYIMKTTGAL